MILGPPPANDELGTDVLAGCIPFICFLNGATTVHWLEIEPPAPLTLEALSTMWQEIKDAQVPLPLSATGQGRVVSGNLTPARQMLLDYLHEAHAAALRLLARWPRASVNTTRWQHLELPGGREDPVLTERLGARIQGVRHPVHGMLPARSARRVGATRDWPSGRLADAARRLIEVLSSAELWEDSDERERLMHAFAVLADRAAPSSQAPDPPMSTWPPLARRTFELMLAAIATAAATNEETSVRAPICFVWRLYEAWVAAEAMRAIDESTAAVRIGLSIGEASTEWIATWALDDGRMTHLCTQLRVGAEANDLTGRLPFGLRSVSSELIPDAVLVSTDGTDVAIAVVDAKSRSATSMTARDCAEAASKYVWGLRVNDPSRTESNADLEGVWIATTAYPPTMFSPLSRIKAVQVHPDKRDEFGRAMRAAVDLALDG